MGESLTQQRRVNVEALRGVKFCQRGRILTVPSEEAPANSVPAAAVIRGVQALSGIIGRKAFVGGTLSLVLKTCAQHKIGIGYWWTGMRQRLREFLV